MTATASAWTPEKIRALGVRTDVKTAGDILGLGRTQAYDAVKRGRFPVPVIHVNGRPKVPVVPILRLLGIDEHAPA